MTTNPDSWVYGDFAPDPHSRDLPGLKARWLVERLPTLAAPAVLDYGAGEGKHLNLVRSVRPQAHLVGVDVRAARSPVDFEFHHVAPDAPLPFAAETYDVVISCDVLEHVTSIEASLAEIHRVLRRGGAFIGFVPAEGGPGPHALFRLFDRDIYRDTKDHHHAYTRRELLDTFSSRFRVVRMAYSYHLIGASLDAAFFAGFKLPVLGPKLESFWRGQENPFYRGQAAALTKRSLASRLAGLANRAAYYESTLLRNIPTGAKGIHFHVEKA
ncbi:MAG TPA: methyltransferase domain-containing protein [Steroidobacteraceae bacterium]